MSEASFASLEPTLLARKGGAKPAMRPQLAPIPETVSDEQLDDLGWNDMGDEQHGIDPHPVTSSGTNVVAIDRPRNDNAVVESSSSPIVQRRARDESQIGLTAAAMPLPNENEDDESLIRQAQSAKNKAAKTKGVRRTAFTLRLDAERHLKLRLAATIRSTSAQAVVMDALDAVFAQIDDLDLLASRIKPH